MATYSFGDDGSALRRLELVAAAYEPISRTFLAENTRNGSRVALDLGCGPGFSTQLVGEVSVPRTLVGIDSSTRFLDFARWRVPTARFEAHDVAVTPLPHAPAELIYARLVLAHLPDPIGTAERWQADLATGGALLIEDLEAVDAPPGPLRAYEEISAVVVRSRGGVMYAGAALARLGGRCSAVTVSAAAAAEIYLFNVERWIRGSDHPAVRDDLGRLRAELSRVAGGEGGRPVSWIVRQVVLPG